MVVKLKVKLLKELSVSMLINVNKEERDGERVIPKWLRLPVALRKPVVISRKELDLDRWLNTIDTK